MGRRFRGARRAGRIGLVGLAAIGALASPALAQEPASAPASPARREAPPVVVVMVGDPSGADAARADLEARAREGGRAVVSEADVAATLAEPGVDPAGVAALEEALRGLAEARELAARLEEREALAVLARTRARVETLLAVPGSSRWAAEVEVAIAVVAHQAGASALAERSLRAAATLDPSRILGSAEAPPALVTRARAIAEETAGGRRSTFRVEVDAVPSVRPVAFLDDVALPAVDGGPAFAVEAPVGEHVLRVEAPGFRPYARRLEVYEGARPAVSIRLAPEPTTRAATRAVAAARRGDPGEVAGALEALGRPLEVWMALPSAAGDRSLLVRCRPGTCGQPERAGQELLDPRAAPEGEAPADPFADRAFLLADPGGTGAADPDRDRDPSRRGRRRRIVAWTAAGVAVLGAGIGASLAARPGGRDGLTATIDFGELGSARLGAPPTPRDGR